MVVKKFFQDLGNLNRLAKMAFAADQTNPFSHKLGEGYWQASLG
jgi:hypothetical protein